MQSEVVRITELLDGDRVTRERGEDCLNGCPVLLVLDVWVALASRIGPELVPNPDHSEVPHHERPRRRRSLLELAQRGFDGVPAEPRLPLKRRGIEEVDTGQVRERARA